MPGTLCPYWLNRIERRISDGWESTEVRRVATVAKHGNILPVEDFLATLGVRTEVFIPSKPLFDTWGGTKEANDNSIPTLRFLQNLGSRNMGTMFNIKGKITSTQSL